MNSRRQFLLTAPLGAVAFLEACKAADQASTQSSTPANSTPGTTPGAPPAFGTAPQVGPEVTPATFAEAEKLMQVTMTPDQRQMAAESWRRTLAALLERRTGPRKVELDDTRSPATIWNPSAVAHTTGPAKSRFVRSAATNVPLPTDDAEIAFAPVTQLSRWIQQRQLTSKRLTEIYLQRIEQFDGKLRAIITPTREFALAQAEKADAEIAARS